MTHRDAWVLLDQFLDGALTARVRWSVAAHLDDCPTCRAYVGEQARLRGVVRDHLVAAAPPEDLTARLQAALAKASQPPAPIPMERSLSFAVRLATVLGPAVAAIWLLVQVAAPAGGAPASLQAEFAAAHALFAHDESMLDVSGDAAAIRAWLRDEAGLDVATPELPGYELVGSRLLVINGKPAAQLVYESRPGDAYLSLVQYQDAANAHVPAREPGHVATAIAGTTAIVSWTDKNRGTALVAGLPDAELRRIATALRDTSASS